MKKFFLLLSFIFIISCEKDPLNYTLTIQSSPVEGGTFSPTSPKDYEPGSTAIILATPSAEYVFDGWTGSVTTSDQSFSMTMDADKSLTANFIKKQYPLTITIQGEGTVSENVIEVGVARTDYNSGSIIELTANPSAEWVFYEWKGDLTGTENPKQITIDKPKTVTAVFEILYGFYLDTNGVTIKAGKLVKPGDKGDVNGDEYTAVDRATLLTMVQNGDDVSKVVTTLITDMSDIFNNASSFDQDISSWDVSNVTNMKNMFKSASSFNKKIGNWDVSNVTTMERMFSNAHSFNKEIGNWDVSNVTTMEGMFRYGWRFNKEIGNWDVSNVTNMKDMFSNTLDFNKEIGSWDVSKVTTMKGMFFNASFNEEIGNWDVSNVTDMSIMFCQSKAFNQTLDKWDVSNVTDMSSMFSNAKLFNQPLDNWDVSNVTDMNYMFQNARSFNKEIGNWDVSNVTNMERMFAYAVTFNQDLSSWCVSNVTNYKNFSSWSDLSNANMPKWGTCP